MRAGWAAAALALLTACAPTVPYGEALPAGTATLPPPINSLTFVRRDPLPGQPNYLQTIKYIDDGMKYIDPLSQFYISQAGEMCFRIRPNYSSEILYYSLYRDWCMYPQSVDRVEAATDDISGIYKVRLRCAHAYPLCVHNEIGRIENSISAGTIDYLQERAAVENLVHVMGGLTGPRRFGSGGEM